MLRMTAYRLKNIVIMIAYVSRVGVLVDNFFNKKSLPCGRLIPFVIYLNFFLKRIRRNLTPRVKR